MDMVAPTCNPRIQKGESTGLPELYAQPTLHSEFQDSLGYVKLSKKLSKYIIFNTSNKFVFLFILL